MQKLKRFLTEQELVWYVKWASTVSIMFSVTLLAGNWFYPYNIMLQFFGNCLWIWAGFLWKENAVILTNAFCNVIILVVLAVKFI
jgi:hypothetical protein